MIKEAISVINPNGLHARPAATFAKIVKNYNSKVSIISQGKTTEIRGMVSILGAGIKAKSKLELICEGADELEAMTELKSAFANAFGE